MKLFRSIFLVSTMLLASAGASHAVTAYEIVYDSTESGDREVMSTAVGQLTSTSGAAVSRNPCWTRVRHGDFSGASVAYETNKNGDFGIYETSYTCTPNIISAPVVRIDWVGSNETDADWIPTGFKTYTPNPANGWSKTDQGQLVFVSDLTGVKQVYKMIGGVVTQVTFSTGAKSNPTWAKQGDTIIYESGGGLYEIPSSGGTATLVKSSGSSPSGDPNSVGLGGVVKSSAAASEFIYSTGGIVTTQPNIYTNTSASNTQPTADFDGRWFAYVVYRYNALAKRYDFGIETYYRPSSLQNTINSAGLPNYDKANPDLISLYEEPQMEM